jgi:hypothetical protein
MNRVVLGDIAEIITGPFGSMLHKSDYVEEGFPLVMPQDIGDRIINFDSIAKISEIDAIRLEKYEAVENDIIYARRGDVEKHAFVVSEYGKIFCGTGCLRVRVNPEKANPLFISFYLSRPESREWISKHAVGSNMPNINTEILSDVPIELPDKAQQQKVVDFLSASERKILHNRKINDNLEQQAKLLYDYWFTQFDFPNADDEPYQSSGGKMVWNEILKRNIPFGWQVVPFLEIASWESNSQPPKSEFIYEPKAGYIRFIQNRDYDSDTHKTYIPLTKYLSVVDRYDILMDKYGDAGAVRYGIEGAFNVALGKISVHNSYHREYVRSFLESDGIYNYLHNSCMASTRASLNESNLAMLNIVIPNEHIVLEYEKLLRKIRDRILQDNDETARLIELRDWLLPMLMNGQATIDD